MTIHHPKVTAQHLGRKAVVYLRQSSPRQVQENLQSQRLQYALRDRAITLGFGEVEIIDDDLGTSAALGAKVRKGFTQLLGSVALEIRPETPVSGRKNLVHVKLVYDDAGLATKPNRVCCNKKYGSRIREIQVTARKPFRARFGRSCGVDRACITGSLVFMAGFCLR